MNSHQINSQITINVRSRSTKYLNIVYCSTIIQNRYTIGLKLNVGFKIKYLTQPYFTTFQTSRINLTKATQRGNRYCDRVRPWWRLTQHHKPSKKRTIRACVTWSQNVLRILYSIFHKSLHCLAQVGDLF